MPGRVKQQRGDTEEVFVRSVWWWLPRWLIVACRIVREPGTSMGSTPMETVLYFAKCWAN